MDPIQRRAILAAFEAGRSRLPPVAEVRARPNVSRLASLTRRQGRGTSLNLSTAVVEAGPEAWTLVAPALEGDRVSLERLRALTRDGVRANRNRRRGRGRARGETGNGRGAQGPGAAGPGTQGLPETPCQGTSRERRYLLHLIDFVRSTSGDLEVLSGEIQLRISRRMTSRLGLFSHRGDTRRITLSHRLFRPGLESILWDTVKHELAHLADQATSPDGRTSHGPRWKAWARRLGARPERLCSPEEARLLQELGRASARGTGAELRYPPEVERWLQGRASG